MLRHWGTMKETIGSLLKFSLLCGIISFHLAASAQCKFTTLTIPGSTADPALGINNHVQIVGDYDAGQFAKAGQSGFVVHNGVFQAISDPKAPGATRAIGINNFSVIVGSAGLDGFVLRHGKFTTIHFPGSSRTAAHAINDSGVIVGVYGDSIGFNHAFMLKNGKYTNVD